MKALLLTEIVLCTFMFGCCINHHKEPAYPNDVVLGWKEPAREGVPKRGVFILRKGEAIDNGKIQVQVTDIIANDPCDPHGATSLARATVQFIRLSDQHVLCSDLWPEHAQGS